ncbi:hypothetical protein TrRE_jg10759, partial [Triparma retinervis]
MSKEMAHFEALMARKDAHPDEFRSAFAALAEENESFKATTIEDEATILSKDKTIKSLEDEVRELRATALKDPITEGAARGVATDGIGPIESSNDNEIAMLRQKINHLEDNAAAEVERLNAE